MGNEWLNNLKRGDKVYVEDTNYGSTKLTLTTIIKITQKGSIKVESGRLFKNGRCRFDPWHSVTLIQHTPELEAKIKAEAHYNHMCYSINAQDMRGKPLDQVQRIYDILKEGLE